ILQIFSDNLTVSFSARCFLVFHSVFLGLAMRLLGQTMQVTYVPPVGANGTIQVKVTGVADPSKYKIAIVDDVFGSMWSKPYDTQPSVPVGADGAAVVVFITGGQDACAQKIHLFLLNSDAAVPVVLGSGTIPPELYRLAAATYVVDRATSQNEVIWAGHKWFKKDTGIASGDLALIISRETTSLLTPKVGCI